MRNKLTSKPDKSGIDKNSADSKNELELNSPVSPFVKSIASGVKLRADFDYKKEYRDYLSEKYR